MLGKIFDQRTILEKLLQTGIHSQAKSQQRKNKKGKCLNQFSNQIGW